MSMPHEQRQKRALKSALTSSAVVLRLTSNTQSVMEPLSSGTRMASPLSLPLRSAGKGQGRQRAGANAVLVHNLADCCCPFHPGRDKQPGQAVPVAMQGLLVSTRAREHPRLAPHRPGGGRTWEDEGDGGGAARGCGRQVDQRGACAPQVAFLAVGRVHHGLRACGRAGAGGLVTQADLGPVFWQGARLLLACG